MTGWIDPDERPSNYGLTSRLAAGFNSELSASLERALPQTLVWDHPSINRIVDFLLGKTAEQTVAASGPMHPDEPIAIVGMACRFPGASSPEQFWQLLSAGDEAVRPVPENRWDIDRLFDPDPETPGTVSTRRGGFLEDISGFDAAFFGISPREALEMDPQQRISLELAYEALERSGIKPSSVNGSRAGVFIGAMWSEYGSLFDGNETLNQHSATGRDIGVIANRISYSLGAMGPSMTVDTACSASLVAVHLAIRSLRAGDGRMALAGGVNLMVSPDSTVAMTKFGAMAPDGRSKAFDAAANGYVRGEGAGVIVLMPLSEAYKRGISALALIKGSAINNDGPSNGLTAPNPDAQVSVLKDALAAAKIGPHEIDYVEAHGTGTQLGDPIEAGAIGRVYGQADGREKPLTIGSVKTNIGHLEAAAGIAGLIKSVLVLNHKTVPPILHFAKSNPHIDFKALNLRTPVGLDPLEAPDNRRLRVGVSSFGFGGTNAHVILEAPSACEPIASLGPTSGRPVVFVYTGNGGNWPGMGRDLLVEPGFRSGLVPLQAPIQELAGFDVFDALADSRPVNSVAQTTVAQLLTFALQAGLSRLLSQNGISPTAVTGHSLGEIAAAYGAGILSAHEAVSVVFHRSMLQSEVAGEGAMGLLHMPWQAAETALKDYPDLVVSGANDKQSVTVSGPSAAVSTAIAEFAERGVSAVRIAVDIAYHSPAMDPLVPRLKAVLSDLCPRQGRVSFHSTVTGKQLAGHKLDADYFARNLREPVRFTQAFEQLCHEYPDAVFIEVGPHPLLVPNMMNDLMDAGHRGPALASLVRGESGKASIAGLLERLAELGVGRTDFGDRPTHILAISAKSEAALREYASGLLGIEEASCPDICHALSLREAHPVRYAAIVHDKAGIQEQLRALIDDDAAGIRAANQSSIRPNIVFDGGLPNLEGLLQWRLADPEIDQIACRVEKAFSVDLCGQIEKIAAADADRLAIAVGIFTGNILQHWGIQVELSGTGRGNIIADILERRIEVADALAEAIPPSPETTSCLVHRLDDAEFSLGEQPFCEALCGFVARLWMAGATVDWLAFDAGFPRRQVQIPTYPYQHKKFWPQLKEANNIAYEVALCPVSCRKSDLPDPGVLVDQLSAQSEENAGTTCLDELATTYARRALESVEKPSDLTRTQSRQWQALERLARRQQTGGSLRQEEFGDEISLITRVGEALPGILDGTIDPLAVLFSSNQPDLLSNLYSRAKFARCLGNWTEEVFSKIVEYGGRNFVEIGAGTGATTARLVPILPDDSTYLFTDVSNSFLSSARQRFNSVDGFDAAYFNIEDAPADEARLRELDAAIAVNVLHATRDIRATLCNIKKTLKTGGHLILGEVTGQAGWLDLVFGTLDGWWRFDDEIRTERALLNIEQWREILHETGFEDVAHKTDGDRQSIIIAQRSPDRKRRLLLGQGKQIQAVKAALEDCASETIVASKVREGEEFDETWIVRAKGSSSAIVPVLDEVAANPKLGKVRFVTIGQPSIDQAKSRIYGQSLLSFLPDRFGGQISLENPQQAAAIPFLQDGEDHVFLTDSSANATRLAELQQTASGSLSMRQDAVYLVTGGLGAIGFAFARFLARNGARHIALLSRHASKKTASQHVHELKPLGASAIILNADVADRASVRSALDSLKLPVAAVVHAAGVMAADLNSTLPAKLEGARILAEETEDMDLDFLLLVSSAAGTWGAPGMAAYAASNAAMDTYAREKHASGRKIFSAGFGRFEERGLLSPQEDARLEKIGMRAMPVDRAIHKAWELAAAGRDHAVIADIDWARFGQAVGGRQRQFFEQHYIAPAPQPDEVQPVSERRSIPVAGDLRDVIRHLLAEGLGYDDTSEIADDQGFFEMGLDSLSAVRLRQRLEQDIGQPVPAAALFSHPTVARLAQYLAPQTAPQAVVARSAQASDEPIAIIGVSCRFPGGVKDYESFRDLVFSGIDAVGEVPSERWDWRASTSPETGEGTAMRWGGFLSDVDQFDASFFKIPPTDAAYMDPQQRLMLEVAWHGIEHGGLDPRTLSGSNTGVFVGLTGSDYAEMARSMGPDKLAPQAIMGLPANTAAGRIAHTLGLEGPALTLDTACSSSLAALHLACNSIRSGECTMALAGGVNLILSDKTSTILSRAGMLSPDGRCRTFDAEANGFVRAEGCGVAVLKPLSKAEADGDPVLAVIRGSAMGHDGKASGLTVPNGSAQHRVIREALNNADIEPSKISYVELHGTGTPLGDPVEASAIVSAFGESRSTPLVLGSLKSNVGHMESAAGIGGLLRTIVTLRERSAPANLHFNQLNPLIDMSQEQFLVPSTKTQLGPDQIFAGVSAFGASGTNVHMILEEYRQTTVHRPPLSPTRFNSKRHWIDGLGESTGTSLNNLAYQVGWQSVPTPANSISGCWHIIGSAPEAKEIVRAWQSLGIDASHPTKCNDETPDGTVVLADQTMTVSALQKLVDGIAGKVVLVTRNGLAVKAGEQRVPEASLLCALGRCFALSAHNNWAGAIDLSGDENPDYILMAHAVALGMTETEIALRGDAIFVPRMRRIDLSPAQGLDAGSTAFVTGAFGGLGSGVVRRLFQQGIRNFALVSRNPRPDMFDDLVQSGANVLCSAADVSDLSAMSSFADEIDAALPPVGLIVHAAGVRNGSAEEILEPKLAGSRSLQALAPRWPQADLILFGSGAALWGDANLAHYAAANGALHGIADEHRRNGYKSSVIDFGPVHGGGMLDEDNAALFERIGLPSVSQVQAVDGALAFASINQDGVIADIRWPAFLAAHESKRIRPFLSNFAETPSAAKTTRHCSRHETVEFLTASVASLLGIEDLSEIDPGRGFITLGMDSFGLMELRKTASEFFGKPISAALMFEAPSIDRLADHLADAGDANVSPGSDDARNLRSHAGAGAIAIIGAGLRLPGGLNSLTELSDFLARKGDAIGVPPTSRHPSSVPEGEFSRVGGWLDTVDEFDADIFGISPREAIQMDPQHRLLMQVAWETLQQSGRAPGSVTGTNTGVFVGITGREYADIMRDTGETDAHSVGGSYLNAAAGRISHSFGLAGPSMAIDTACSSSATAVHLAGQSLLAGECSLALAGGANLVLSDETSDVLLSAKMLSPDHRCRTFDEAANGYVRAEGIGLVLLKRLEDAEADGDRVLAIIRGSAMNHDGASGGFTVPNGSAQRQVIRKALTSAGVEPADVSYVEAHGTGTRLGDPVEIHALADVYSDSRRPLKVGSIKSNIGHAEAAAGIAGLFKLIVAADQGRIPGHPHFNKLNPEIAVDVGTIRVVRDEEPWEATDGRRLAGLSAFGASGTNVHIVVEAPDKPQAHPAADKATLLVASAMREADTGAIGQALLRDGDLGAICRGAALSYTSMPHRIAVVAGDIREAREAFAAARPVRAGQPRIGFMFTGQGSQLPGMAQDLYRDEAVFRETVDEIADYIDDSLPVPLAALLTDPAIDLADTAVAQPALFGFGVGLAALWKNWGVLPEAVMGHSLGEITAATVSGMLELEKAARFVVERGRLMGSTRPGSMAAVLCDEETARAIISRDISIAALNGPENTVISGAIADIDVTIEQFEKHGIAVRPLPVTQAFHSALMEPVLPALEQAAQEMGGGNARLPLFSNLDGQARTRQTAQDWRLQVRSPVAFSRALSGIADFGCDVLLEIGPRPILTSMGRSHISGVSFVPGFDVADKERSLLRAAGTLWKAGATVDLAAVLKAKPENTAELGAYPFQPVRYWPDADTGKKSVQRAKRRSFFQEAFKSPAFDGELARDTIGPEDWPEIQQSASFAHIGVHLFLQAADCSASSIMLNDTSFLRPLEFGDVKKMQRLILADGHVALLLESTDGECIRVSESTVGRAPDCSFDLPETGPLVEADVHAFYDQVEAHGLTLGDNLKRIETLSRTDEAVVATLSSGDPERRLFGVQLSTYEAMAQAAAALFSNENGTRIAAGWKRLTRTGSNPVEPFSITARKTVSGLADVTLLGDDGATLVHIEALAMVPYVQSPGQPWCGQKKWLPVPQNDPVFGPLDIRSFGSRAETFAETLRLSFPEAKAGSPVVAIFGPTISEETNCLTEAAAMVSELPHGCRLILAGLGTTAPQGLLNPLAEAGAGIWGIARTLAFERADLELRMVDFDPDDISANAMAVEYADRGTETAVAWRNGTRFVERLVGVELSQPDQPSALSTEFPHKFVPISRRKPASQEVEIEVNLAALNFRDVLVSRGLLGSTGGLGAECLGQVVSVGSGVDDVAVGQTVVAYVPDGAGAIRTHLNISSRFVRLCPEGFNKQRLGSFILSAMTARRGLIQVGQIKSGETVLVHQAASAVGLCAIALARKSGASVIATAHPDKHAFLNSVGVTRVFNSRKPFSHLVKDMTGEQRVDLAFGAFGDLIDEAQYSLAKDGRVVDLTNSAGRISPVDVDRLVHDNPAEFAALFDEAIVDLQDTGMILPVDVLPAGLAADGLQALADGGVVGRKAVDFHTVANRWQSVLVTGSNGGIGQVLARHLSTSGVQRLFLVDLTAPSDIFIEELEEGGTSVSFHKADVTSAEDMGEVLRSIGELDAVIHTATSVADGPLSELGPESFDTTFAAKVEGARILDVLTRNRSVQDFILLSSVTALLPSAGQAAYAAANTALELIAGQRRAAGYHATCQAWGPWSTGIGAQMGDRARQAWRRYGIEPVTPQAAMLAFDRLHSLSIDPVILNVDWQAYYASAGEPILLSEMMSPVTSVASDQVDTDEHEPSSLRDAVAGQLRHVLKLPYEHVLDPQRPFVEFGLDSLLAAEFADALGKAVGRRLPGTLTYNYPTLEHVVDFLAQSSAAASGSKPVQPVASQQIDSVSTSGDADTLSMLENSLAKAEKLLETDT